MKRVSIAIATALLGVAVFAAPITVQTTVAASATYFKPADVQTATQAFCRLETAEIRYVYDGSIATASYGLLWEVGEEKLIQNTTAWPRAVQNFNAIRTGGTSGQLDCTYSP